MKKKLVKNTDNKMVGGVIAGIADYFDQDPTFVRVLVIALAIITGLVPVLIFYFVAWFVMPDKDGDIEYRVID